MQRLLVLWVLLLRPLAVVADGPVGMYCGGNMIIQLEKPLEASKLNVVVFDPSSAPIAGAHIQVEIQGATTLLLDKRTDSDGKSQLKGLKPGKYWLGISAQGFQLHVWDLRIGKLRGTQVLKAKLSLGV